MSRSRSPVIRPKLVKLGTVILIVLAPIVIAPLAERICAIDALADWSLVAEAHAYKVEKICEEITNKYGKQEKCRSVLVKEDGIPKKEEKKADEKKPAGHH